VVALSAATWAAPATAWSRAARVVVRALSTSPNAATTSAMALATVLTGPDSVTTVEAALPWTMSCSRFPSAVTLATAV
jgi:hypothetical protein